MDPLRFAIAAIPLAVYLLVIALLNLRQRPFVTTGSRDLATLAVGILGLMVIGPFELFLPEAAAIRFGPLVWIVLLVFYGLCVSMVVLLMRPRLVIYNSTIEQLRPIISEISQSMDQKSRWTGDSLVIPSRRIHFHLESVEWMNNVQIISSGTKQSYEGWRELEKRLSDSVQTVKLRPNVFGVAFATAGAILMLAAIVWLIVDRQSATVALDEILRR
jgi:hypothetical protein